MNDNWQIKIIDTPSRITRDVFIYRNNYDGSLEIWKNDGLKNEIISKDDRYTDKYSEPTLRLLPEQLQILADSLNFMGIKPQKGFIEGKLEGTEKHLEDMRKLVFKKLKE